MTTAARFHPSTLRRCRGVGLVTAIFLLVVIAALAVAMTVIYTSQRSSSDLDLQGARAYQAARAGMEWGLFRQRRQGLCTTESFAMDPASSLAGFTVTVACEKIEGPVTRTGDEDTLDRWRLKATACNFPNAGACPNPQNNPDYVQRVMEVQF